MTTIATLKRRIRELEAASTPEARAVVKAAKKRYESFVAHNTMQAGVYPISCDQCGAATKREDRAVARLIAKEER